MGSELEGGVRQGGEVKRALNGEWDLVGGGGKVEKVGGDHEDMNKDGEKNGKWM